MMIQKLKKIVMMTFSKLYKYKKKSWKNLPKYKKKKTIKTTKTQT